MNRVRGYSALSIGLALFSVLAGADGGTGSALGPDPNLEHALARAEAAFSAAERAGYLWLSTREHLESARRHLAAGRIADAEAALALVTAQSNAAVNQSLLERARYLLARLERSGADAETLNGIIAMIRAADGAAALEMARAALSDR